MAILSTQFADCNTTPSDTQTFALTVPASTKRMLVGVLRPYAGAETGTLSTAAWNGTAGTVIGATAENEYQTCGVASFVDPTIGAYNLTVTLTTAYDRLGLVAVYLDDYGTVDNFAAGAFLNNVTVTSDAGKTVVAWVGNANGTSGSVTAGSGETEVAEYAPVNGAVRMAVLTEAGAASVVISPTAGMGGGDDFAFGVSVASTGSPVVVDAPLFFRDSDWWEV